VLANREFGAKKFWTRGYAAVGAAPTVLGYYLLVLLGRTVRWGSFYEWIFAQPLVFTWQAAVVAALSFDTVAVKSARAAFESVDHGYERPARTLGAERKPGCSGEVDAAALRRSVLAAGALAFARSLGDFGVTLMIAGNIPGHTQTVAIAIYDAVKRAIRRRGANTGDRNLGGGADYSGAGESFATNPFGPRQSAL